MKTRKTGAGFVATLVTALALAACGDVEAGRDNGGFPVGDQPGRDAPAAQVTAVDPPRCNPSLTESAYQACASSAPPQVSNPHVGPPLAWRRTAE